MKPSDVANRLIRIANNIDASGHPSISMVMSDLRLVLAAITRTMVVVNKSKYGDIDGNLEVTLDKNNFVISSLLTYTGMIRRKGSERPEPFVYSFKVTSTVNDEDNIRTVHGDEHDIGGVEGSLKLDGVDLDSSWMTGTGTGTEAHDIIDEITSSRNFEEKHHANVDALENAILSSKILKKWKIGRKKRPNTAPDNTDWPYWD